MKAIIRLSGKADSFCHFDKIQVVVVVARVCYRYNADTDIEREKERDRHTIVNILRTRLMQYEMIADCCYDYYSHFYGHLEASAPSTKK
jgi:hypothetical protein